MPTYDYKCTSCGNRFESFQKMSDFPHDTCPSCGGPVTRLISAGSGIIIKNKGVTQTGCGSDIPCCERGIHCGKAEGCR